MPKQSCAEYIRTFNVSENAQITKVNMINVSAALCVLLFILFMCSYRPLLSVDEDLTAGDVHSVPRQSQTQLVRS